MTRGHVRTLVLALLTTVAACSGHGSGTGDPDAPGGGDDVDASNPHFDASIDGPDDPGGPAAFAAQPMSLTFGAQPAGTVSSPMTVMITNTGGTVSGPIDASVLQGSFAVGANSCTAGLRPDGVCIVQVRFQPQTAGQKMNMMTVTDGTATVVVPLSGLATQNNGGNPVLHIEPSTLDFGPQSLGSTTSDSLTVSNVGTAATGNLNVTKSGSDYALGQTNCGQPLQPNASCTINVSFTPLGTGPRNGSVTVSSSSGGSATAMLTGSGQVVTSSGLVWMPSSFDFGDVKVGDMSSAKQFSLVNNTTGAIGPLLIAKSGANIGDFELMGNACGGQTLGPGEACTVFVTFEPGFVGPRSAQMRAGAMSSASGATADLSGNGALAAQ